MNDFDSDEIFMEELKKEFFEKVSDNLIKLNVLYANKDFKEIRKIAHDIKGTAGLFDLMKGSELGKELQEAADNNESERVKHLIDELTEYMKNEGVQI